MHHRRRQHGLLTVVSLLEILQVDPHEQVTAQAERKDGCVGVEQVGHVNKAEAEAAGKPLRPTPVL